MDAKIIGSRLKKLREERNLPRDIVAKAVNISVSALSMYETGKRIPRDEVKLRLARFYDTDIASIFFLRHKTTKCGLFKGELK